MKYALAGVKSFFLANLETVLQQIETDDSVTIPRWQALETHEVKTLQFPLIEILPAETQTDYSDDESPFEEGWEYHDIDIEVAAVGQDSEEIKNTLLNYRDAFKRLIKLDKTFGNLFNRVRLVRAEYSPLMEAQKERKLLKILRQNISVRTLRT